MAIAREILFRGCCYPTTNPYRFAALRFGTLRLLTVKPTMSSFSLAPRLREALSSLRTLPFASLFIFAFVAPVLHGQGCVALKLMGEATCSHGMDEVHPSRWGVAVNYQYFRSHRHFVGTEEQTHRYDQGSEVINLVNQVTTAITYQQSQRLSWTLNLPYFHALRTSLYEHDRVNRYETKASGLGDVSVGGQLWLRNPGGEPRSNLSVGLSLKLPTGDSNVKDDFFPASGVVRRNVDQSIQPGDGGWGVGLSLQAFRRIGASASVYATVYYLVNPRETSGTYRSDDPIVGRFSVADQYQARAGVSYLLIPRHSLYIALGGRLEGIPSSDLIGGDLGFRRPGYSLSVEPGFSMVAGAYVVGVTVPVAVERNRVRSYADKLSGRHGDAAFADFAVNVSLARRW